MSGTSPPALSALVVAHNEEDQLAECLASLAFADERVVVLDRCTDGSGDVARGFTDRIVEGAWPREGERRNAPASSTAAVPGSSSWTRTSGCRTRSPARSAA